MIRLVLILSSFTLPLHSGWAQETKEPPPSPALPTENDALSSLPIGATLTKFSHPRFDQNQHPISLLTAERMIVTSQEKFTGEGLVVRLFDKTKKVSTRATMDKACFLLKEKQIEAYHHLLIRSSNDQFAAEGPGGLLHLETQQGLLNGPARTAFTLPQKRRVSMKLTAPLLFATLPLLTAAPPAPMTEAQLAEFEKAVTPPPPPKTISAQDLGEFERAVAPRPLKPENKEPSIAALEKNGLALNERLTSFLQSAGQLHLLAQAKVQTEAGTEAEVEVEAEKAPIVPEEQLFVPGKDRMTIEAGRGIYFDNKNREIAYLGKIKLVANGLTLTCNNGLRAIMQSATEDEKENQKKDAFTSLGELKQFTANGEITVQGTDDKGQPVSARADRALYNAKTNEIILRGKKMFFRHGAYAARTSDPKATVRIELLPNKTLKVGSFENGLWELGAPLNQKKKK